MTIEFLCSWLKKIGVYLLLIGLFILHLPFLSCDPALNFCGSRGPFTDEGIYLFQIRNYLNGHGFNLYDCDAALKTPLFSLLFLLPFKIFGIHLYIARAFAVLLSFIPLVLIARWDRFKALVSTMVILGLTQIFLFQYMHYALAEVIACCWILYGLVCLFMYYETGMIKYVFVTGIIFMLVFLLKIQFAYILLIPALLLLGICFVRHKSLHDKNIFVHFFYYLAFIGLAMSVFYLLWYHPRQAFFQYLVLKHYDFPKSWSDAWSNVKFNYEHVLLNGDLRLLVYTFYLFLLIGVSFLFSFKTSHGFKFVFVASILWVGIEAHKLSFSYIPIRYMLPMIFAGMLLISSVISESIRILIRNRERNRFKYVFMLVALGGLLYLVSENSKNLKRLFSERTYAMKELSSYIKTTITRNGIIVGNWAPSLTWEVANETMIVASHFLNDEKIFTSVKPVAIITEEDEADSEGAFRNMSIDLFAKSDSIKYAKVGRWQLEVFRIK